VPTKHIRKSAHAACASHLAILLQSVASNRGCVTNPVGLFNWIGTVLHPPKRGGRRRSLSATIKDRISAFKPTVSPSELSESGQARRPQTSDDSRLSQAVSAKLEDGSLRAAIRLLMYDTTPTTPSAEYFAKLKQKHPHASVKAADVPSPSRPQCLSVYGSDVFHFLPALLEVLMACDLNTFPTCYSVEMQDPTSSQP